MSGAELAEWIQTGVFGGVGAVAIAVIHTRIKHIDKCIHKMEERLNTRIDHAHERMSRRGME